MPSARKSKTASAGNPGKPRGTPRGAAASVAPAPHRTSGDALFDEAPVAMHEIDREGVIRRVNRAECQLLGFEPAELLNRHASDFVAGSARRSSRLAVRRKMAGEQPLAPFLREFQRRDGARLTLQIHESFIYDHTGAIAGIRSALLDVTEQHRAQEELRRVNEELEARVHARTAELALANEALQKEVAERRRTQQRLAVQYGVARVLAESATVEAALPRLLEAIGTHLGGNLVSYWAADPQRRELRVCGLWQEPEDPACAAHLRGSALAPGQGVPGAVWDSGLPAWIDAPLEETLGWPLPGGGYRCGLAFPVLTGGAVFGVMAMFCRLAQPHDDEVMRTAALLGSQIGQFIEGKNAENARDRIEARFTAFMDHLPGVAFIKDTAGRYVYLNPAVRTLMERDPESMLNRGDLELWPPDTAAAVIAHDRKVRDTGKSIQLLQQFPGPGGAPRSWLVYKFPVPDRDGRLLFLGGMAVDVTERQLIEAQLRQSQKMDAVGRLAGGVAHDFNNLLTVIGGYGRMVFEQLPAHDRTRESMELILDAADRAALLTSQLLAFSRRQMVQPKLIELNHVVSNLEKMLRRVIGEHIVFETSLDPELPRVKADAGQVEQVLMNLAINARDAMPDGGTLTIESAASVLRGTPHARLSVIDTGVGMDRRTRGRLFEPFFTTKGRGKGTGLGLSTVYGIVKQHGGEIVVESEPNAGTRFHTYFPAVAGQPPAEAPEALPPRPDHGTETILLAEDEAGVRRVAGDTLRSRGYRVLEAADGQEALRIAAGQAGRIQLLLTDMIMPLMSGRELAQRLTESDPAMRVIFMSGYTHDVIAYHGNAGPEGEFLEKPFAPDALARKVRGVLDAGKAAARASRRTPG